MHFCVAAYLLLLEHPEKLLCASSDVIAISSAGDSNDAEIRSDNRDRDYADGESD